MPLYIPLITFAAQVLTMKKRRIQATGFFAIILWLFISPSGLAFSHNFAGLFFDTTESQKESAKNRAAAKAKAKHGGKVLSVRKASKEGEVYYKVKLLLDSGRIKIVTIKE